MKRYEPGTILVKVCDSCGHEAINGHYTHYDCPNSPLGVYRDTRRPKEVVTGNFTVVGSWKKGFILQDTASERKFSVFTEDLLKYLEGKSLGTFTMTEHRYGGEHCWKPHAEEDKPNE